MSQQVLDRDAAGTPAPSRTRRLSSRRLAAAVLGSAVAGGLGWHDWTWWQAGRFVESTDDAFVGGDVTAIAPKVAGFIAGSAVADNRAVQAGDLLAKLDDRDHQAALARNGPARPRNDPRAAYTWASAAMRAPSAMKMAPITRSIRLRTRW